MEIILNEQGSNEVKYTIFDRNLTLAWSKLESQIKELLMFSVQQLLDLDNLERKGA